MRSIRQRDRPQLLRPRRIRQTDVDWIMGPDGRTDGRTGQPKKEDRRRTLGARVKSFEAALY